MANAATVKRVSVEYKALFGSAPKVFFSSPGRLELLGNHTDHNHGKVLVAAVDLDIIAGVTPNDLDHILIHSEGFPVMDIDLRDLKAHPAEAGTSSALVRGIAHGFRERQYSIGGFTAYMESEIFEGAGVSSSAAFELLICEILNYCYNGDRLDRVELAKIGQAAETGYFGKPCGLLDQMGVALGGVNYIDFRSTENPIYKHITLALKGYQIVLTNTGGSHAGLTPFYAAIKDDMRKVARYFGKDYLRDVPEDEFRSKIEALKIAVGPVAVDRAIHFYEENKRVELAFAAIESRDTKTFLAMVRDSGQSSRHYLKNISVGHPETEALTIGLDLSEKLIKDGAVRVHGGGFAGTMLAFVAEKEAKDYLSAMKTQFGSKSSLVVKARPDGVKALQMKRYLK